MEAFFTALLQCTLSMSVITLVYAAVLPLLSKRYSPKWRYLIWLVIAVGWLIPFRPMIELPFLPAQGSEKAFIPSTITSTSPVPGNPAQVLTAAHETVVSTPLISLWAASILIWMAGVIFMLAYHTLRHRRFMKMVSRWSEAKASPEILNLLDELKREQGIKTQIEYKPCRCVSSPMLVGFLHPVILMPPVQLSESELTLILRHELTHFKRHDLWYKAMILIATVLHWFNPVVYFMARAASVQCEISCDALVLQDADMQARKQYGETIIAVIRNGRTHQTTLSTNFYGGKRGMKNRIVSMLDSKRKRAGVAVLCVVLAGIMLTGATLVSAEKQQATIPDTAFTKEEYGKLLALQFEGYEDMTVAEFQQQVWTATDTDEYLSLLERFYMDEQLEQMRDTNKIAGFLFYTLTPLTAEKWQVRSFGGYTETNYEDAENAQLEYTYTLSIQDANRLTVGEYNTVQKEVTDGLLAFFQEQTKNELQNEQGMNKALETKADSLTKQYSTTAVQIDLDYWFLPLTVYDKGQLIETINDSNDSYVEERNAPSGTEEDYRSLLKLKTADYQNRTLTDFNTDLLEWANEDYERMMRVENDTAYGDFSVSLSPEELSFVTLTVHYSGSENAVLIKSLRTGEPKENIGFGDSLPEKTLEQEGQREAWCSLYYQGSYHITDDGSMAVGERDRCVGGVISDIQKYWDTTSLDELLTMSKQDVLAKLESIATQYSSDLITISILPDQVSFDVMDERSNNE